MKSKALVHLVIAVILALMAGFLTINWLKTQRAAQRPAAPVEKKVEVVVAGKILAKGTRLKADALKLEQYAPGAVPSGAFFSLGEVEGRTLSRDVAAQAPITPDKLYPKGQEGSGLVMAVEKGRRAVTVKGNKVLGAAGLTTPGSRVDVLMTISVKSQEEAGGKEQEYQVAKLILADVPVLATGSELETRIGKDGQEELSSVDTYTLEVTPEEAEKLALASTYGALSFAVRKVGDNEIVNTAGADIEAALNSYKDADQIPVEEPAPPAAKDGEEAEGAGYSVETIRGVEKEQVTLDQMQTDEQKTEETK